MHRAMIDYLVMSRNVKMGRKMTENFHENKMFWKEVQRIRKRTSGSEERVKAEDGTMLVWEEAIKER